MNGETYPNIKKVVRATDVLLGWVFTWIKLSLLFAIGIVILALMG